MQRKLQIEMVIECDENLRNGPYKMEMYSMWVAKRANAIDNIG